jgi:hypothetical protein
MRECACTACTNELIIGEVITYIIGKKHKIVAEATREDFLQNNINWDLENSSIFDFFYWLEEIE